VNIELDKTYLITTDNWFYAPDGESYRAVFGTVTAVSSDSELLGISTNRHSSNWYVVIGNMIVAGCQIHYAMQVDSFSKAPPTAEIEHEGIQRHSTTSRTRIYDADQGAERG